MKKFKVTVHIFIKTEVVNPEEVPTKLALHNLGFGRVSNIRMGRCFVVSLEHGSKDEARADVKNMCETFLTNNVTESFEIVDVEQVSS